MNLEHLASGMKQLFIILILIGLAVGGLLGSLYGAFTIDNQKPNPYQKLIKECEANIPRTQTCELVARPKVVKNVH